MRIRLVAITTRHVVTIETGVNRLARYPAADLALCWLCMPS